jgi:hypothetical protein
MLASENLPQIENALYALKELTSKGNFTKKPQKCLKKKIRRR